MGLVGFCQHWDSDFWHFVVWAFLGTWGLGVGMALRILGFYAVLGVLGAAGLLAFRVFGFRCAANHVGHTCSLGVDWLHVSGIFKTWA